MHISVASNYCVKNPARDLLLYSLPMESYGVVVVTDGVICLHIETLSLLLSVMWLNNDLHTYHNAFYC